MKKTITAFMATAAVMGMATTASAKEAQISGGMTYLFDSADSDFSFTAATVRGAYFFNEVVGAEIEMSTGVDGIGNYADTGVGFDLDKQFGGYLVGHWPAGESGEFFGRVGIRTGTFDVSAGGLSDSVDYDGFSLGGGYTYFFENGLGIRGEITTSGAAIDGGLDADGNLTSFSLSLAYKFGQTK